MTSLLTAVIGLASASALATTLSFQTPVAPQHPGLVPVAPAAPVPGQVNNGSFWVKGKGQVAPVAQVSIEQWRERLTANDFQARGQAFDEAARAFGQDADLQEALVTWAADKDQGDLAWTAFMILRQGPVRGPGIFFPGGRQGSPFGHHFSQSQGGHRVNPFGGFPTWGSQSFGSSQGTNIEMGPDGLRVTIESEGPNGKETKTFEAGSLEELKAASPELFEAGGALEHMLSLGTFPGVFEHGGLDSFFAPPSTPDFPSSSSMIRTDILGVYVSDFTAKGDEPQALLVDSVLKPSIAWVIGLQSGDVIIRVAGQRVRARADIGEAMATVPSGASFDVEWITKAGETKTETWNAAPSTSD